MLKQRIITAAILIPVTILLVIYLPPFYFALATALVTLLAAWEWSALMQLPRISQRVAYLVLTLIIGYAVLYFPVIYLFALALAWWLLPALLVVSYPQVITYWRHPFVRGLLGLLR